MTGDELKRAAAMQAVTLVESGMRLGLGTGSTAQHFVALLGEKVRQGLDVIGVPTSEATRRQAEEEGIRLTTLEETPSLDLTVDGADELDDALRLVKGGGGALLREKIVAAASSSMVVIADSSKHVARLGRFPLPVEVVPFGIGSTRAAVEDIARRFGAQGDVTLRKAGDETFVTDGGHFILDIAFGAIAEPEALARELVAIPGVVEHGLFIGLCQRAFIATHDGVKVLAAS